MCPIRWLSYILSPWVYQMKWYLIHMYLSWFSTTISFDILQFLDCFEVHLGQILNFKVKCVIFLSFYRLQPHGVFKWHEIWYRCTLVNTPQDLIKTDFNLWQFRGTLEPKTDFRGKKMCQFKWSFKDFDHMVQLNHMKFATYMF